MYGPRLLRIIIIDSSVVEVAFWRLGAMEETRRRVTRGTRVEVDYRGTTMYIDRCMKMMP